MNRDILRRAADRIHVARQGAANLKADDIIAIAVLLERYRRKGGSHLMYKSPLPGRRVLPVTGHPSEPIGRGLALKMLNILEGDIDAWEEELKKRERQKTKKKAKGNGHA